METKSTFVTCFVFILKLLKLIGYVGVILSAIKLYFPDWLWLEPDALRWFIIIPVMVFALVYMLAGWASAMDNKKD